jgi:hypothetical protein
MTKHQAAVDSLTFSGILFELAGLCYFLFYLVMSRPRNVARFSRRSRILTLLAAIAMVGSVVGPYAQAPLGIVVMFGLAIAALVSTFADRRGARR